MSRTALVLRHVHFEDLGSFARPLKEAGYSISYSDVGDPGFCAGDPLAPDLLVILGGPVGVYEVEAYPFLATERRFIAARLSAGGPTLGICLGAQLIAAAVGAEVFPTGIKEIGFAPLVLTEAGRSGPLRHLADIPVLHWHGDTYSLPRGAENLASTPLVEQQAFAIGSAVLGMQFHAEAETDARFERWLVGHAHELAAAEIGIEKLRADANQHGLTCQRAAQLMLAEWLRNMEGASSKLLDSRSDERISARYASRPVVPEDRRLAGSGPDAK